MLHLLKPYVDRYPALATTYRQLRDQWRVRALKPRPTPYGFTMIADASVHEGRFEPDETALLQEHLPRIDVLVDIGANVGFFTCLAATRGVKVVAVEPLQDNLTCLYENLHQNGLDAVEVFPMGVSDVPGLRRLYGASTGASLVAGWSAVPEHYARTIAVSTLDHVLRGRFEGQRMFVKMDIEGAEVFALRGAAETLARAPAPTWLVEVCLTESQPEGQINPHFAEVFAIFRAAGYTARTADGARREVTEDDVTRWVSQRRRDFGTHNFLFTRDP
jgi:FkbM family methyltransferase